MNLYQNEFIQHAYKNEENMRIAILAGLSFDELRKKIIDEFVGELFVSLGDAWASPDKQAWSKGAWQKFRKENWAPHVYVGIGPEKNFQVLHFGVISWEKEVEAELRSKLSASLQVLQSRPMEKYCAWRIILDTLYSNLNSVEGLMTLSKYNRQAALADLREKIERMGSVLDDVFKG